MWTEEYTLDERVEVTLWTVVMAIRYGMGRMTYANGDASSLARQHWGRFPPFMRRMIRDDARNLPEGLERMEWEWLITEEAQDAAR